MATSDFEALAREAARQRHLRRPADGGPWHGGLDLRQVRPAQGGLADRVRQGDGRIGRDGQRMDPCHGFEALSREPLCPTAPQTAYAKTELKRANRRESWCSRQVMCLRCSHLYKPCSATLRARG